MMIRIFIYLVVLPQTILILHSAIRKTQLHRCALVGPLGKGKIWGPIGGVKPMLINKLV